MATDYLDSPNFLKKLPVYLETRDEYILQDIIDNHLQPMIESVVCRISYLSQEDKEDAVSEAIWRCVKCLDRYDPQRMPPFAYFSRIAFNERHRAVKREIIKAEKHPTASLDAMLGEDREDSHMARFRAEAPNPTDAIELRWAINRLPPLMREIVQAVLSEDIYTSAKGQTFNMIKLQALLKERFGLNSIYTKKLRDAIEDGGSLPEPGPGDYAKVRTPKVFKSIGCH